MELPRAPTENGVAFANIFMVKVETENLKQSALKQLVWKRFIDDIFSLWDTARKQITQFSLTNTIKKNINLRLKYPKQKQSSWTLLNTKAKDLKPSWC